MVQAQWGVSTFLGQYENQSAIKSARALIAVYGEMWRASSTANFITPSEESKRHVNRFSHHSQDLFS